jgi:uncharacterized repeat protein (TIGR03803 family)
MIPFFALAPARFAALAKEYPHLYGTTRGGGQYGEGTVFERAASGAESILWNFGPYRGPIADANGNLYGTTELGGAYNDGTVFELSPTAS